MVVTCCVCKKAWKPGDAIFHRFPTNPEKQKRWSNLVGYIGDLKTGRVCSDHFKQEDYTHAIVSGNPRLRISAEPSLKLRKNIQNGSSGSNDSNENNMNDKKTLKEEIAASTFQESEQVSNVSDIPLSDEVKFCALRDTLVSNGLFEDHDYCKRVVMSESLTSSGACVSETANISSELSSKGKHPSCSVDWVDLGDDDEFMKYKRIKDVKWENVVNDPKKATICWQVAVETVEAQKQELKKLRANVKSLEAKVSKIQGLMARRNEELRLKREKRLVCSRKRYLQSLSNRRIVLNRRRRF